MEAHRLASAKMEASMETLTFVRATAHYFVAVARDRGILHLQPEIDSINLALPAK